jgi:gamma-polyglutamate synthase
MNKAPLDLLQLNLDAHWKRIHAELFKQLLSEYAAWEVKERALEGIDQQAWEETQFLIFLQHKLSDWLDEIALLKTSYQQFSRDYHNAVSSIEKTGHLVDIAKTLKYSRKAIHQIHNDKAKWLDENAMYDCFIQRTSRLEQNCSNVLNRMGDILVYLLSSNSSETCQSLWNRLELNTRLLPELEYQSSQHVRLQAFTCLRKSIGALPDDVEHRIAPNLTQYIYRCCFDIEMDVWLRCEAILLVADLDVSQFISVAKHIIEHANDNDIFVRSRLATILCKHHLSVDLSIQIEQVSQDSSEFVRQALLEGISQLPHAIAIPLLIKYIDLENEAKVRAAGYLAWANVKLDESNARELVERQIAWIESEEDEFGLRVLLETSARIATAAAHLNLGPFIQMLETAIKNIHIAHKITSVRRWAAETEQHLWALQHQHVLTTEVQNKLRDLPLHDSIKVKLDTKTSPAMIKRLISFLGSQRFGFDISQRRSHLKIRSGYRFGFRLWRLIYEFRYTATDKRQNHNHIKGRIYRGDTQTSSVLMGELSQTKVPGEPLFISEEQGWRHYLPLMDQVLSSLDQGWPTKPVCIYSPEGVTEVMPPRNIFKRLLTRARLILLFDRLAQARNWQSKDAKPASHFVSELTKIGFELKFRSFSEEEGGETSLDPSVQRYFASTALPFTLPTMNEVQNYFYSVYQNSVPQLLLFATIVSVGYIGRHVAMIFQFNRLRKKIPLVVGGWGTRGKSGTERLKAALFNAMGLSVLSKTTGCEAMFLFGPANRSMREMFLFRPYDKATIWEQVFLTKLGGQLKADVYLWECMGLTPRYIEILQNQWMKDDLATITNCYPDHEDLQGPAGIEIPIVMQRFIPKNSTVITTEETMLPLLEDAARQQNTALIPVNWLEAGLLTDDILTRFPYEEHPNNIALVAKLAQTIGVPRDFALKAMADHVVADLGVLKIYPVAHVQSRKIEFINGMSANERMGAIGNWTRLKLDQPNLDNAPNRWLGIVINNRADRIARSKVFASMIIKDTHADSYLLIGNNLAGFVNYVEEAWDEYKSGLDLSGDSSKEKDADSEGYDSSGEQHLNLAFFNLCQKYRIITSQKQIDDRVKAMIDGLQLQDHFKDQLKTSYQDNSTLDLELIQAVQQTFSDKELHAKAQPVANNQKGDDKQAMSGGDPIDFDAIIRRIEHDQKELLEYQQRQKAYIEHCQANQSTDGWQSQSKDWVFEKIKQRITIVEDYYATGNQTIQHLVTQTPPGLDASVIGVQNIKGTGLDFIYRWQAWDEIYQLCQNIRFERDVLTLETSVKALSQRENFGLLDEEAVVEAIDEAESRAEMQREALQAELKQIKSRLEEQMTRLKQTLSSDKKGSEWLSKVIQWLEAFLDAGDAIRRRKTADQIYLALIENLISYDRAALELSKLTKAQKGGWLQSQLSKKFQ